MSRLFLVRHGESQWNKRHIFTGWTDITLTKKGIKESQKIAIFLKNIKFDLMFTSRLERARATLLLIASEQDGCANFFHENGRYHINREYARNHLIPVFSEECLNERHYGFLQGMRKHDAKIIFGEKQVFEWRRSYKVKPPEGESLEDVYFRVTNFFKKNIEPILLKDDKNILISAHGNSLRALIKYIDNISDENIVNLELAPGDIISYTVKDNRLIKDDGKHKFTRPLKWK